MPTVKIALISDLHIGLGARSKDLCPEPSQKNRTDYKEYKSITDENFLEKFVNFIQKENIVADYLFVSGDITDNAQPDQIELAITIILSIAKSLNVPEKNIIVTPGNHDVDWSILKEHDPTGFRWGQRYEPLVKLGMPILNLKNATVGNITEEPYFSAWSFDDLIVVSYNSSHHDNPDEANHHGYIDPEHLKALDTYLSSLERSSETAYVFLVHHHPILYSEPISEMRDFSAMINSENLLNLLSRYKFDLVIHGHRHTPRFSTHSIDGQPDIAILSAGSFSIKLKSIYNGVISNQFHLVELENREKENHMMQGAVKSWSYSYAREWEESNQKYTGISHIEPFGTYLLPHILFEKLKPIVEQRFQNSDYLKWTSVTKRNRYLRNIRPEMAINLFDSLANHYGYERFYDDPMKMMLIKN